MHRLAGGRHTYFNMPMQCGRNFLEHSQGVPFIFAIFEPGDNRLLCPDQVGKFLLRKPGIGSAIVNKLGNSRINPGYVDFPQ